MAEDCTWAGHMELQAASLICMANICIHQAGQPRWEIVNYRADRWFHVTYEGSEHYNSIRLANRYYEDDEAGGPISLLRGRNGVAVPGGGGDLEPSQGAVVATVAEAKGVGKKTRAREILCLMVRRQ
jgi:OTU domain-containing protein 3